MFERDMKSLNILRPVLSFFLLDAGDIYLHTGDFTGALSLLPHRHDASFIFRMQPPPSHHRELKPSLFVLLCWCGSKSDGDREIPSEIEEFDRDFEKA
ncbi:hypothetical protein LXL04_006025 [Taraxacum kok-saghyz]